MKQALYSTAFTVVMCALSATAVTVAKERWEPIYKENKRGARNVAVVEAFGLAEDLGDEFSRAADIKRDHVSETTKKGVTTFKAMREGAILGHAILMEGQGFEGPIHGILATGPDKKTVLGLRIHHQEETPGLGGRVAEREFLDRFRGKRLVDDDGERLLRVVKGARRPDDVEAISGATMTSKALDRILAKTVTEFISGEKLVRVDIALPKPAYGGPPSVPAESTAKPLSGKERPPFMAPEGTRLLSSGRPVTASEEEPFTGELEQIVDGKKEATEENCVELGFGPQYVQIDLGDTCEVFAVVVWRYHAEPHIYKDVVVRVAADAEFTENVKTLFNNDADDSAGLGKGDDIEHFETHEGKLIKAKDVKGRYVRLYSIGNHADEMNRYTEVEVYGRPAGAAGDAEGAEEPGGAGGDG